MRITFEDLWAGFRKVEQRAIHMFKSDLELVGRQLDALATVFDVIHERFSSDEDLKIIWLYHIGKTITSFEGAISHTLRGLFSESANDIRVGLETLWQLLYLHDNPSEQTRWSEDKEIKTSDVRKSLSMSDDRWQVYKEFCAVSHPRRKAMEWYYTYMEGYVRFGPTFEPEYVKNYLQNVNRFLGWIQEDLIHRLYPNAFGTPLCSSSPKLVRMYSSNREMYQTLYRSHILQKQKGADDQRIRYCSFVNDSKEQSV
ncbi:MAG: hypothetical protein K6T83_15930 [Alicyclobacillus sp.]|nr:hypothetical protein [Alicyclobacillus sp.]